MKSRLTRVFVLLCILPVSFSAYAMNFTPEDTYNSVVVVGTKSAVGSGFAIEENIIVTNAHVVGKSKKVAVNLYDSDTIEGTVIKNDFDKDLALIEVERSMKPLNVSEEPASVGQEVYAIGAPKDMPYTMTKGIVSAVERKLGQNTYIQIDASVNSGNSGGPLVDDDGNVIGVITLKASDAEGIGFAISAKDVKAFIAGEEASAEAETSGEKNEDEIQEGEKDDEAIEALMAENDRLKIGVCISLVANIILILLCLLLFFKQKKKEKDEFDFEIEIED